MKCENVECKSRGFFVRPDTPNEHYCMSHKTPEMVSIRSFGKRTVRSLIALDNANTIGLRTQHRPSVPPSRVPKLKAYMVPARSKHVGKVLKVSKILLTKKGAPVATLGEIIQPIGDIHPNMRIYKEITHYGTLDWRVMAQRIPLIAYCRI